MGMGATRSCCLRILGIQLAEIRRRELELSATVLGIANVIFLEQPDVADPRVARARSWDQERVSGNIAQLIEQLQSQLILTHGLLGGYGHPAHRMVHDCVMKAVQDGVFGLGILILWPSEARFLFPVFRSA
jgi:LmbE family N-acetylglucosaminyl deacetylase